MEIIGDFDTSLRRAFDEIDSDYPMYRGLVVCGSHNPERWDIDYALFKIQVARESGKPFLGICFGHQLAAIEYARNVLGMKDATSEEFGQGTFVVKKRPEGLKVGLHEGETFWSNYDVVEFVPPWEKAKNFITIPYHPEYQSSKSNPHPLLVDFLRICRN